MTDNENQFQKNNNEIDKPNNNIQAPIINKPIDLPIKKENFPKKTPLFTITIIISLLIIIGLIFISSKVFINKKPNKKTDSNSNINVKNNTKEQNNDNKLKILIAGAEIPEDFKILVPIALNNYINENSINCNEEKSKGALYNGSYIEAKSNIREYGIYMPCDFLSSVKVLLSTENAQDGVIVIMSAKEIQKPETIELLSIVNKANIEKIVIYIKDGQEISDKNILAKTEKEIRNLIEKYGFDKEKTPITTNVKDIISLLDKWLPNHPKIEEQPFLMPIEDVFEITNQGTIVTGRIENGSIKPNDKMEIIGFGSAQKTNALSLQAFRKKLDYAEAKDNVEIVLKDIQKNDVIRGQVLATPGSISSYKSFQATIYLLTAEEGTIISHSIPKNYQTNFYFRTTDIKGTITLKQDREQLNIGSYSDISATLETNVAMKKGDRFSLRENGKTIGIGIVNKTNN